MKQGTGGAAIDDAPGERPQSGLVLGHGLDADEGRSTPMSYAGADGSQYLLVVAGGHGSTGTKPGDSVLAHALPRCWRQTFSCGLALRPYARHYARERCTSPMRLR